MGFPAHLATGIVGLSGSHLSVIVWIVGTYSGIPQSGSHTLGIGGMYLPGSSEWYASSLGSTQPQHIVKKHT